MRKFLVIAVLAGLAALFAIQKRNEPQKALQKKSRRRRHLAPPSAAYWMKRSLDRTNEVKRRGAAAQEDGADNARYFLAAFSAIFWRIAALNSAFKERCRGRRLLVLTQLRHIRHAATVVLVIFSFALFSSA